MSPRATARRVRSPRGDATRSRILRTALRLFARRGIDAVSLNEIVRAARVNSAGVHYHFGSKQGLISALLDEGAAGWGERRDALLDELHDVEHPTLRDVVTAMVVPTVELTGTTEGRDHVRLVAAVAAHPTFAPLLIASTDRYTTRYLAVLERATPQLGPVDRLRRYGLARAWLYHALAIADGPLRRWLDSHGVDAAEPTVELDVLIDTLTALLDPA